MSTGGTIHSTWCCWVPLQLTGGNHRSTHFNGHADCAIDLSIKIHDRVILPPEPFNLGAGRVLARIENIGPKLPAREIPNIARSLLPLTARQDNIVAGRPHRPHASVACSLSSARAARGESVDRGRAIARLCVGGRASGPPRPRNRDCPFPLRISHPFQMEAAQPQAWSAPATLLERRVASSPQLGKPKGPGTAGHRGSGKEMGSVRTEERAAVAKDDGHPPATGR